MEIQFFCPRWGSEDLLWDEFITKARRAGYDGIEYAISRDVCEKELDDVWDKAARKGMLIIAQHYDTNHADFNEHYDAYAAWLERIRFYPCIHVNSQTGKDFFSFEQNKKLIELAGEGVVHETHRGKFSFAAHVTRNYLNALPELLITLDASHWVNVSESYLEDQQDCMKLAIERTMHIHARAGHPEGPQVANPRSPEWQQALQHHLIWWDKVVEISKIRGDGILTITPEFGPFPYMVHVPATGAPVADQWEVNKWMMEMLRERYG